MLLGDTSGARSLILIPGFFQFKRQTPGRWNCGSSGVVHGAIGRGCRVIAAALAPLAATTFPGSAVPKGASLPPKQSSGRR